MAEDKLYKTKKTRSSRLIIFFTMLLIVGLACNAPSRGPETSDQPAGFVETSVAKTMMALEEEQPPDVGEQNGDNGDQAIPTLTVTPENTPKPTLTPTITDTPTPQIAMVYVSENTNCRTGQGTEFQWLVTLLAGKEAEAVGIDTSGEYWYIRRPDQPSTFCWLWGNYATPSGPYQSLPVYTPVPTPTPGFNYTLAFYDIKQCTSSWIANIQIENIGSVALESWRSTGVDNTGGLINTPNEQNSFYYLNNCSLEVQQFILDPGEGSFLNAVFSGDITGHDLEITINVCTEDNLGGECFERTISFTP